jgi:hypothetical protein
MANHEIEAIEKSIKQAKANVELGSAIERLKSNRDFRKMVLEGYFEQEAVRLVHLKADPSMQSPTHQAAILRDIDAIGAFKTYLDTVLFKSDMAAASLADSEAALADALAEEGGE